VIEATATGTFAFTGTSWVVSAVADASCVTVLAADCATPITSSGPLAAAGPADIASSAQAAPTAKSFRCTAQLPFESKRLRTRQTHPTRTPKRRRVGRPA